MPSGARRRKAAKKKGKTRPAGNGDVKLVESESSSPASLDLEPQQNPFSIGEGQDVSIEDKTIEDTLSKEDGSENVMEENEGVAKVEVVRDSKSVTGYGSKQFESNGGDGVKESANGNSDNGNADVVEKNIVTLELGKALEDGGDLVEKVESFVEEVSPVKDAESVAQVAHLDVQVPEKVIHVSESVPIEKPVRSEVAELKSKKSDEKVYPSQTLSQMNGNTAETRPLSNTSAMQPSGKVAEKELMSSNPDSTKVPLNSEKELLLLKPPKPETKTSWTGCCGLYEVFAGSGR